MRFTLTQLNSIQEVVEKIESEAKIYVLDVEEHALMKPAPFSLSLRAFQNSLFGRILLK